MAKISSKIASKIVQDVKTVADIAADVAAAATAAKQKTTDNTSTTNTEDTTDCLAADTKSKSDKKFVWMNYPLAMEFPLSNGRSVTLKSSSETLRGKADGCIPIGTFECTEVASEDWELVQKEWATHPLFKRGQIFATDSDYDGRMEAASRSKTRHGLEPIEVGD